MKAEQKLEKIENFFDKPDDINVLNLSNLASHRFASPRRGKHPLSPYRTRKKHR